MSKCIILDGKETAKKFNEILKNNKMGLDKIRFQCYIISV